MNQGRIWCVVHPTVGLPLLLGSVAITALVVHASVLTHTTWFGNYWQGASKAKTAENTGASTPALASVIPNSGSAYAISVTPVAGVPGKTEASFVISVVPNSGASATTVSSSLAEPFVSKTVVAAAKME